MPVGLQQAFYNYLLTYDSYVPLYNRFHRGEWIIRVSGGVLLPENLRAHLQLSV
jgi:hypothetical protein